MDIYPIILVILSIVSHIEWFNLKSILFFNDWQYLTNNAVSQMVNFGQATWLGYAEAGYFNIQINSFFPAYIWGLMGNYDLAVKLTYMWPIVFLSVLAPYYLLRHIIKDRKISFLGALFYGFSTYLLLRDTAHLPIALLNAMTPIILLVFIKLVDNFSYKNVFYFVLIYSLGCFYEIRIMYIITFILFVYFVVFFDKKNLWPNRIKFLFLIGLFLLINLFWFLPVIFADKQNFLSVMNRGLWGDQFFSALYSLAYFDSGWSGGIVGDETVAFPISTHSWLVPAVSFCALLKYKRETKHNKKYIIFFAIILLTAILLTKQSAEPFGGLYLWLYTYFPGFSLFRLASKFYLLLGIGYLGLFAFGMKYLLSFIKGRYQQTLVFAIFVIVLLFNSIPFVTKEIGALAVNREKPQEYKLLDEKIANESGYFRTMWAPLTSQWAYYDLNHPKISLWELFTDQRHNYGSREGFDALSKIPSLLGNFTDPNLYANIFQSSYGKAIMDAMSVKYLIIPKEAPAAEENIFPYAGERQGYVDAFDKIDYLDKVDMGTMDLTVYENIGYKPPIYVFDELFHLNPYANLEKKYDFITQELKKGFYFTNNIKPDSNLPVTDLLDIYDDNVEGASSKMPKILSSKENVFYLDTKGSRLYGLLEEKQLTLYTESKETVFLNGQKIDNKAGAKNIVQTVNLDIAPNESYYLLAHGQLQPLVAGQELSLGRSDENQTVEVLYGSDNVVPNASFENGLWQEEIGDCHYYDENSIMGMDLDILNKTAGNQSLRMEATTHIACTSIRVPIDEKSAYLLSFDYQSPNAKMAGYYLGFNDQQRTVVRSEIPIINNKWLMYNRYIFAPRDVNEAVFYLYTYSDDNKTSMVNNYDNLKLTKMQRLAAIELTGIGKFEKADAPLAEDDNIFTYLDNSFDPNNIILNPSFESGTWTDKVGDCYDYDNKPIIAMNLNTNEKTAGERSLQLEAARHVACTSTKIPVTSGNTYQFSFDYQSPNASNMSYYLGFDDVDKTVIKEDVAINDKSWHTFTKNITIPDGVTQVSLFVYARPVNGNMSIINRYDNFKLVKIPDISGTYYLVSKAETQTKKPVAITFDFINPTKRLVHIKGATAPFYLAMNESYHTQWQARMNNQKVQGFLDKWVPWAKPDRVEDNKHFALYGFLNGWYAEPEMLCYENSACTKNPDGSYDMEMVIEFSTQRWFYLGLFFSGATLLGCLGYWGYGWRKRRRKVPMFTSNEVDKSQT